MSDSSHPVPDEKAIAYRVLCHSRQLAHILARSATADPKTRLLSLPADCSELRLFLSSLLNPSDNDLDDLAPLIQQLHGN